MAQTKFSLSNEKTESSNISGSVPEGFSRHLFFLNRIAVTVPPKAQDTLVPPSNERKPSKIRDSVLDVLSIGI